MTKVFVHGNPEVAAIWGPLAAALGERNVSDIVLASPPGFGAATPPGWGATMSDYAAWLVSELEALGGGIDLLGHDWGAGHVLGAVAARPDLVRSYAIDCAGLVHPEYVWHDAAQAWQQPDVGEALIAAMLSGDEGESAAGLEELGVPAGVAAEMAHGMDAELGRCVLALYRSAAQPAMAELGDRVASVTRPAGLAIVAMDDAYVPAPLSLATAERFGAETFALHGRGHWWMFEDPGEVADRLVDFWSRPA